MAKVILKENASQTTESQQRKTQIDGRADGGNTVTHESGELIGGNSQILPNLLTNKEEENVAFTKFISRRECAELLTSGEYERLTEQLSSFETEEIEKVQIVGTINYPSLPLKVFRLGGEGVNIPELDVRIPLTLIGETNDIRCLKAGVNIIMGGPTAGKTQLAEHIFSRIPFEELDDINLTRGDGKGKMYIRLMEDDSTEKILRNDNSRILNARRSTIGAAESIFKMKLAMSQTRANFLVFDSLRFIVNEERGPSLQGGIPLNIFYRMTDLSNLARAAGKLIICVLATDTDDERTNNTFFTRLIASNPVVMKPEQNEEGSHVLYSCREGDRTARVINFTPKYKVKSVFSTKTWKTEY